MSLFLCLLRFLKTCRSNFPTHTFGKENAFPVLTQFRLFPDRLAHSIPVLAARLAQKTTWYRSHQLTRCSHTPDDVCIIPLCCTVKVGADRSRLETHIRKDTCSWTSPVFLKQWMPELCCCTQHFRTKRLAGRKPTRGIWDLRTLENLENLDPFRSTGGTFVYDVIHVK